jgi:hypothetical protein
MTQTGKMMQASNRINALAKQRREKAERARENGADLSYVDALNCEAHGLDQAAGIINDVLAS